MTGDLARLELVEQVVSCTGCELHGRSNGPVAFRGPAGAEIVVLGEAPGEQENVTGQPFVGPAGKKMTELLLEAGFDPDTVGWVNTVSCWPVGTETGTPGWPHIDACAPNKAAQLDYFDPAYVFIVGKVALKGVRRDLDLKHGRGRPFLHDNRVHFASYHPAAALRVAQYETSLEEDLAVFAEIVANRDVKRWQDFIPIECASCMNPAVWWDEPSELGWCENHSSSARVRMDLVRTELEAARVRHPKTR